MKMSKTQIVTSVCATIAAICGLVVQPYIKTSIGGCNIEAHQTLSRYVTIVNWCTTHALLFIITFVVVMAASIVLFKIATGTAEVASDLSHRVRNRQCNDKPRYFFTEHDGKKRLCNPRVPDSTYCVGALQGVWKQRLLKSRSTAAYFFTMAPFWFALAIVVLAGVWIKTSWYVSDALCLKISGNGINGLSVIMAGLVIAVCAAAPFAGTCLLTTRREDEIRSFIRRRFTYTTIRSSRSMDIMKRVVDHFVWHLPNTLPLYLHGYFALDLLNQSILAYVVDGPNNEVKWSCIVHFPDHFEDAEMMKAVNSTAEGMANFAKNHRP